MDDFNKAIEVSPKNDMAISNRDILLAQINDYNNAKPEKHKMEIK